MVQLKGANRRRKSELQIPLRKSGNQFVGTCIVKGRSSLDIIEKFVLDHVRRTDSAVRKYCSHVGIELGFVFKSFEAERWYVSMRPRLVAS